MKEIGCCWGYPGPGIERATEVRERMSFCGNSSPYLQLQVQSLWPALQLGEVSTSSPDTLLEVNILACVQALIKRAEQFILVDYTIERFRNRAKQLSTRQRQRKAAQALRGLHDEILLRKCSTHNSRSCPLYIKYSEQLYDQWSM